MAKHAYAKTYEDIYAHAKSLTAQLEADPDFRAVVARARTFGITVSVTLRHTCAPPEYIPRFIPDADASGKLPARYAMELWVDLNCGDHILAFTDDEGNDVYVGVEDEELLEQVFNKYLEIVENEDEE